MKKRHVLSNVATLEQLITSILNDKNHSHDHDSDKDMKSDASSLHHRPTRVLTLDTVSQWMNTLRECTLASIKTVGDLRKIRAFQWKEYFPSLSDEAIDRIRTAMRTPRVPISHIPWKEGKSDAKGEPLIGNMRALPLTSAAGTVRGPVVVRTRSGRLVPQGIQIDSNNDRK